MKRPTPTYDDPADWLHPAVREVFRDETLWVLDKPAGLLSHPNPPADRATNAIFRAPYDLGRELYRFAVAGGPQVQVHLIHRLDQETSGLIVCAFRQEAAALLKEALYHHGVEKEYRALVLGIPRSSRGEWTDRLEKTSRGGKASVTTRPGEPNAATLYSVVERFEGADAALLSLRPETGRTHQLRVQAASRGHPIAGDDRYGDFGANRFLAAQAGLKHMFLHAIRIEFRHPATGHILKLQAPLSSRLAAPLERIRHLGVRVPRRA
jgi:23S rRNA pseudouridine955/2504/2580 synthase